MQHFFSELFHYKEHGYHSIILSASHIQHSSGNVNTGTHYNPQYATKTSPQQMHNLQ